MKKIIIFLMAIVAVTATAQTTFNDGTFKYELTTLNTTGETVAKVTGWYAIPSGSNITVTVPGYVTYNSTRYRVDEIGVTGLAVNDNSPNTNIRTVRVGYGVTRINNYAFRSLSNLYMVQLPSSINYLGYDLFYNNSVAKYVVFPGESVPNISTGTFRSGASSKVCSTSTFRAANVLKADSKWNAAFSTIARHSGYYSYDFYIGNLYYTIKNGIPYKSSGQNRSSCVIVGGNFSSNTKVTLNQSINYSSNNSPGSYHLYGVADSTFVNNSDITQVVNSNTMAERIGNAAFRNCTSLQSVDVPVDTIDIFAFYGCTSLYSANFTSNLYNLEYLGSYAFGKCNLSGVTIPQSTKYIGNAPFYDNSLMTEITVNTNNTNYCSYYNALYNKSKTYLYQLPGNWQEGIFPETLQRVLPYAAAGWRYSSLYLPYNVKILDQYAFQNCKNLKTVHFPSSMTSVNANTFAGCDAINRVEFNTMTPPAGDIFPAVTDKSSVDLYMPYGSYDAYANSSIWSQYNRKTDKYDHQNCYDFRLSNYSYTVTSTSQYNYNGYSGNGTLRVVKVPTSSTFSVPTTCTYANKSFVPTEIGSYASEYYSQSFEITSAPSITKIDEYAFANSYLTNFPFINVEIIDLGAFVNCYKLAVDLGTGSSQVPHLKKIMDKAFFGSGIKFFTAPTCLEYIGFGAFMFCSDLHEIFLPHIDGKHNITIGENFFGSNANDFKCWVDYRRLNDFTNSYADWDHSKIYPHVKLDSEWQSFACVMPIDFDGSGLTAYTVTGYNQSDKKATLSPINTLKEHNGAVVHGEANGSFYRLNYASWLGNPTSSWLVGVDNGTQTVNSNSTTSYFKLNANEPQFEKITSSTTFNRGYAYLKIPTSQTGGATTIYTNLSGGSGAVPGDVNGDGHVNSVDVTALYNWLIDGNDSDIVNGDQDGDGHITSVDVTVVYNILLGN